MFRNVCNEFLYRNLCNECMYSNVYRNVCIGKECMHRNVCIGMYVKGCL